MMTEAAAMEAEEVSALSALASASSSPQLQVLCKQNHCMPPSNPSRSPTLTQAQIAECDPPSSHSEYWQTSSPGRPVGWVSVSQATGTPSCASVKPSLIPMAFGTGTVAGHVLPSTGPNLGVPSHCHLNSCTDSR